MKLPYEDEAIRRYQSGERPTEIERALDLSPSQLYNCLRKNNIPLREDQTTTRAPRRKTCPKCKSRSNPKEARFCCMCGTDIRTREEICVERLGVALKNFMLLPDNLRDETVETIREAIACLKSK